MMHINQTGGGSHWSQRNKLSFYILPQEGRTGGVDDALPAI